MKNKKETDFLGTSLLCWRHVRSFNISIVSSNLKVRTWFFSYDTIVRNRKVKTFIFETRHTNNALNRVNFIEIHSKQCHFTLIERVIVRQQNDKKNQFGRARSTHHEGVCKTYLHHFTLSFLPTYANDDNNNQQHRNVYMASSFIVCIFFNCNLFKMKCTFTDSVVCVWMHCTVHHFIRASF